MTDVFQDIIALLTDFGPRGSHYVASMKAVILKLNPNVNIIDISHDVSSFSIIEASYLLKSTYKLFPELTVFIIVVDPGVGSSRNILALKTKENYYFIGPDNGIFFNLFNKEEIEDCIVINNTNYFNKPVSPTFHGRDIMAPVGAHIINGVPLSNFGSVFDLKNLVEYPIKLEISEENRSINCTIQYLDSFGNLITNIPIHNNIIDTTSLKIKEGDNLKIIINNQEYEGKYSSYFGNAPLNSLLFLKGSSGYLEISVNQGSAAEYMDLKVGQIIKIVLE